MSSIEGLQLDNKQLSEEEAHTEANMIRAYLGVSPETGKITDISYKKMWFGDMTDNFPTKEQYEKGFKEVEKLMEIAEKDPEKGVLMAKTINLTMVSPILAGHLLALSALYAAKIVSPELSKENRQKLIDKEIERIKEEYKIATENLNTPVQQLENLKERSEEYKKI